MRRLNNNSIDQLKALGVSLDYKNKLAKNLSKNKKLLRKELSCQKEIISNLISISQSTVEKMTINAKSYDEFIRQSANDLGTSLTEYFELIDKQLLSLENETIFLELLKIEDCRSSGQRDSRIDRDLIAMRRLLPLKERVHIPFIKFFRKRNRFLRALLLVVMLSCSVNDVTAKNTNSSNSITSSSYYSKNNIRDVFFVKTVMPYLLKAEGEDYNGSSSEPGGGSKVGVSKFIFDAYLREFSAKGVSTTDLKQISYADASEVMYEMFWKKFNCDKLPPKMGLCLMDAVVQSGQGAKLFQRALDVTDDGIVGKNTIKVSEKINVDFDVFFIRYIKIRKAYYASLSNFDQYGPGWFNRLNKLNTAIYY